MKQKLTALTLMIFSFSCLYAQTDSTKLKEFSQNLVDIEKKFTDRENKILDSLKALNKQIDLLKGSKDLAKRIDALEKKLESLDQLDKVTATKDVELVKVRYEAGLLVIKDIIELLKALKSQYSSLNFQQSYNQLSNPNNYSEYQQNLDFLKKKLVKGGLSLPDLNLNNAFLNVAYSIARSVVSGQSDKDNKINELVCILDFSSRANQELSSVNTDLQYLQFALDKMLINYKELFSNYTSIVGYKRAFEEYISNADDDIPELIKTYFDKLSKKEATDKEKELKTLKFQLKKIADSYLEYEIYIRQGLAYYEKFELIIKNIQPNCQVQTLKDKIQTNYDAVKKNLSDAKASFEDAYKGKIKQSYIKQLSEG